MKGLVYKDFISFWRMGKLFLLALLIFTVVPMMSLMGYGMAFCAMLPFSLIQMDENCHWGRLSVMLPYSNLQLVLSKYLVSWGIELAMAVVSAISQAIAGTALREILFRTLFFFAAASVLGGILNPIAFRFGTQRGRLIFVTMIVVFTAASVSLAEVVPTFLSKLTALPWLMLLLALLVNALSIYLSQRWFRKGVRA